MWVPGLHRPPDEAKLTPAYISPHNLKKLFIGFTTSVTPVVNSFVILSETASKLKRLNDFFSYFASKFIANLTALQKDDKPLTDSLEWAANGGNIWAGFDSWAGKLTPEVVPARLLDFVAYENQRIAI